MESKGEDAAVDNEDSSGVCNSTLQSAVFSCVVHISVPNGITEEAGFVPRGRSALQAETRLTRGDCLRLVVVDSGNEP